MLAASKLEATGQRQWLPCSQFVPATQPRVWHLLGVLKESIKMKQILLVSLFWNWEWSKIRNQTSAEWVNRAVLTVSRNLCAWRWDDWRLTAPGTCQRSIDDSWPSSVPSNSAPVILASSKDKKPSWCPACSAGCLHEQPFRVVLFLTNTIRCGSGEEGQLIFFLIGQYIKGDKDKC